MDDFAYRVVNPKPNRRAFVHSVHLSTTLECFTEISKLTFLTFPYDASARLILGTYQGNRISRHAFCL